MKIKETKISQIGGWLECHYEQAKTYKTYAGLAFYLCKEFDTEITADTVSIMMDTLEGSRNTRTDGLTVNA